MEVKGMTSNEKRERLVEAILEARSEYGGTGVGIYGADVCALCGEIGTFRGWAKAMFGCHYGPHKEFVCDECRRGLIPSGETGASEHNRLVTAALKASDVRYCRCCQEQIQRHPGWGVDRARFVRLCKPCRLALNAAGLTDDNEIKDLLHERVRRRYLELLDPEQLREMGVVIESMRRDLDEWRAKGSRPGQAARPAKKPRGTGFLGTYSYPKPDLDQD